MNREKGFIFPMAIILSLLVCTAIFAAVEIYLDEKKYAVLITEYYQRNTMELLALRDIRGIIESGGENSKGTLQFSNGTVTYQTAESDGDIAISLFIKNDTGEEFESEIRYNQTEKRIVRWEEK
jgi:competence protein ComGG